MANDSKSFVHFKNGAVFGASNDGMEVLGHFLLAQVGSEATFFIKWVEHPDNAELSSGSYFVEKQGDKVIVDHLENERVREFETSRKNFIEILKKWESGCRNENSSACKLGGHDFIIHRSDDNQFTFDTYAE